MTLPEKHFEQSEKLLRAVSKEKVAQWLLNEGYFPEQYVLPPSFRVANFNLQDEPFCKKISDLARRNLVTISYPKSLLTSRVFSIQHPHNYHNIVYYLIKDWDLVLDHLFHKNLKIFSYSLPIPVNAQTEGELGKLRSGRMIYEWIEMAENDMVAEAYRYKFIIRADITNFYNSVYTHSIGWALHGREQAFADKAYILTGNKIDKLTQYSNNARSNGISIGSALSDLIAEIVLAKIDLQLSEKLKDIKFLGTRFKDDYRIFCNSESDGRAILKELSHELISFNLLINESKTKILSLPEGLYRQHDREYYLYSLKYVDPIPFKTFELTLLKVLDIHRAFPGTSLIEKFLSQLFDYNNRLKITFSNDSLTLRKQILKAISLLFLVKRESEKTISNILAIIEAIYDEFNSNNQLKDLLKDVISSEIEKASDCNSIFDLTWLLFFARYMKLGITDFPESFSENCSENPFLKSIKNGSQNFFNDSGLDLFIKPALCRGDIKLAKRFAIFEKSQEEKNDVMV